MNPDPNKSDSELGNLLREWQPKTPLPTRFESNVWQRIAKSSSSRSTAANFFDWFQFRWNVVLPVTVLAVVSGIVISPWQANQVHTKAMHESEVRYVESVDPLLASNP